MHFLDLDPPLRDPATSRVAVIPVPFEQTTSYVRGTSRSPARIIEASAQVEFYDEELGCEPCEVGITTYPGQHPSDWPVSMEAMLERVERLVEQACAARHWPLLLGGEHTLTLGTVRALLRRTPGLCVLQLDAHADLRQEYQGATLNHASIVARLRELCPVVQLGIRALSRQEAERIQSENLPVIFAQEMNADGAWMDRALSALTGPVFLTIDMDYFDPSLIPAVGTPEPGGPGWRDTLVFLRRLFASNPVLGADLVELCPREGDINSDFITARLAYKIIGLRVRQGFAAAAG